MCLLNGTKNHKYAVEPVDPVADDVIVVTRDVSKYANKKSGMIAYLFGPNNFNVFKKTRAMAKFFKNTKVKVGAIFCPISYNVVTAPIDFAVVYGNYPRNWITKQSVIMDINNPRNISGSRFMTFEEDYPVKHPDFFLDGKQKFATSPSHEEWAKGIVAKEIYLNFPLRREVYKKGEEPLFIFNYIEGFPIGCEEDESVFLVDKNE